MKQGSEGRESPPRREAGRAFPVRNSVAEASHSYLNNVVGTTEGAIPQARRLQAGPGSHTAFQLKTLSAGPNTN